MALDEKETVVKDAHPMCIHTMSVKENFFFSFQKLFCFYCYQPSFPHVRQSRVPALKHWSGGKDGPLLSKSLKYQKLCNFENCSQNVKKK